MHLMRNIIFEKFGVDNEGADTKEKDFELLQWEFENIIKNSNADYWLPERAKVEFMNRFQDSFKKSEANLPK